MIRLARPDIDDDDISAVVQVLRSGNLIQGEQVRAFEAMLAERTGVPHVAAVANGTAALHLALLALGVRADDRVAVPTYSWPATANAVVLCGAIPVFVDIEPESLGMDPASLDQLLQRDRRIRAVLPVHVFGRMAKIAELIGVAEAHGIPVVEDAACALGAAKDGRGAGSWGTMGAFSFHPRKAATTGEGGAVVCRAPEHLRALQILRNHGQDPSAATPDFVAAGFNLRLTEFQAALGRMQLAKYDQMLAARRRQARRYDNLLRDLPLSVPLADPLETHVYQAYVVLLEPSLAARRDSIIRSLRARGVEAAIGTYHMPLLTYFRHAFGQVAGTHPVGESVAARAIALPLYRALTDDDQERVAAALRAAIAESVIC